MVLGTNSDSIPTQHSLIVFTTENEGVYCAVGTEYSHPIRLTFFFKRLYRPLSLALKLHTMTRKLFENGATCNTTQVKGLFLKTHSSHCTHTMCVHIVWCMCF